MRLDLTMQVVGKRRRLAVLLVVPRLLQHWCASSKSRATAAHGGCIRGGGRALVCARSARDVLERGLEACGLAVSPGCHGGATAVRCAECCHGSRARGEPQSCAVQHARRCLGGHALNRRAMQDARRASERARALRGWVCARAARVRGRGTLGALDERHCGVSRQDG